MILKIMDIMNNVYTKINCLETINNYYIFMIILFVRKNLFFNYYLFNLFKKLKI